MPVSPIIAELNKIRLERRLSRRALAVLMGVQPKDGYIARWEYGIHSPSLASIERWAEALGYELDLHQKEKPNVREEINL